MEFTFAKSGDSHCLTEMSLAKNLTNSEESVDQ